MFTIPFISKDTSVTLTYPDRCLNLSLMFRGREWKIEKRSLCLIETVERTLQDFQVLCEKVYSQKLPYTFLQTVDEVSFKFSTSSKKVALFLFSKLFYRLSEDCDESCRPEIYEFKKYYETISQIQSIFDYFPRKEQKGYEDLEALNLRVMGSLQEGIESCFLTQLFQQTLYERSPRWERRGYPFSNSFWKMDYLYLAHGNLYPHIQEFIEEVSEREQFKIIKLDQAPSEWIQDFYFEHPTQNRRLIPSRSNYFGFLQDFYALIEAKNNAYFKVDENLFGEVARQDLHHKFWEAHTVTGLHSPLQESQLYFEGGNLLTAVNRLGEVIILSGAHNLLASYLIAEENKELFESTLIQKRIKVKQEELESRHIFHYALLHQTQEVLQVMQARKWDRYLPITQEMAKITISKIEVLKELFQEELGEKIAFIQSGYGFKQHQIDFHLDLIMLPSLDGIVFLQSFEKCSQVLNALLTSNLLSLREQKFWYKVLDQTKIDQSLYGTSLYQIKKELEDQNFIVVEVPGYYSIPNKNYKIHYLNAVVAQGVFRKFVISNSFQGIATGESFLRFAFAKCLKQHRIEKVYFAKPVERTGFEPELINNEALKMISLGGGIHCFTQRSWGKKVNKMKVVDNKTT